jgi:flagellar basal-body rod modification protein FlgD
LFPGEYFFEVESLSQGQVLSVKPVDHYALVREARLGADGVEIVLAGGASVPSDSVRALRAPENSGL